MGIVTERTLLVLVAVQIFAIHLATSAYRYHHFEDYDTLMGTCGEHEACNIVHHRYWMPSAVEKICRCPLNTPSCPVTYTKHGHVMNVNSRTQMKFCSATKDLAKCGPNEIALQKKTLYQKYGMKNVSIVVHCQCDNQRQYWVFVNQTGENFNDARHQLTVVDNYRCVGKSEGVAKCGYIWRITD